MTIDLIDRERTNLERLIDEKFDGSRSALGRAAFGYYAYTPARKVRWCLEGRWLTAPVVADLAQAFKVDPVELFLPTTREGLLKLQRRLRQLLDD